jgi:hypothetical protein
MRRRIELALLAALLIAGPAAAQNPPGSELEESLGRPRRVPVIPAELRFMVREASRDRLVIRMLGGSVIAIDISQFEPENFREFGDGRFLGFSFLGYETYGYMLVDRAMFGVTSVIDTGEAPVFSPDGRHFAAVQTSGAGFGNLEGLGIWAVRPAASVQIFASDVLPEGEEWRIDGWPRADCVSVSWLERPPGSAEPAPDRMHFGVEIGEQVTIRASYAFPGCNVTGATGND